MLFFLLDSIAIVLPAGYVAYRCFPQHILKALLFAFAIVLSLITIVELMLGGLAILNNGTLLGGSILAGALKMLSPVLGGIVPCKIRASTWKIQTSGAVIIPIKDTR